MGTQESGGGNIGEEGGHTLDARGLTCPLPVLRANKTMRALKPGAVLTVLASDPAAPNDFRAYCETAGHELLDSREVAGEFTIVLRKAGP